MDTIETALHDEHVIFCIERLAMKITRIRIGLLPPEQLKFQKWLDRLLGRDVAPPTPPEDENNYWAEAIEDDGKFYYRANGTAVEITEDQFCKVVINPSLHYFCPNHSLNRTLHSMPSFGQAFHASPNDGMLFRAG